MAESLIEELPKIVSQGKREAQKILDGLSKPNRVTLQTNELVLPTKAKNVNEKGKSKSDRPPGTQTQFGQSVKELNEKEWLNRLIYGDNLLAMQALLAGDPATNTPSMRGKIDLIYIDPPFDSKADYRTKIHLPNDDIEQKPTVIEQFAYSDTWKDGTSSYLKMIYPRLVLMRELLSEQGSIYVHIDWHVGHYVKVIMDEIFGKENFVNDIAWRRGPAHNDPNRYGHNRDFILFYTKNHNYIWNQQHGEITQEHLASFNKKDEKGEYTTLPLHGPAHGQTSKEWKGTIPPSGRTWAYKIGNRLVS